MWLHSKGKERVSASCNKPIGGYVLWNGQSCIENLRGEESELKQCQEAANEDIQ